MQAHFSSDADSSTANVFSKKQKGVCSQSNGGLDSTQTVTTFNCQWIRNIGESEFVEHVILLLSYFEKIAHVSVV